MTNITNIKAKLLNKETAKSSIYGLIGLILYTLALNLFLVRNNIAAGGFAGIATVLNYLFPVPVGAVMLCLNIPLMFFSLKVKGIPFTLVAFVTSFIYSFLIDFTAPLLPVLTYNKLLASILGGLVYGVGLYCLYIAKVSVGGTDLLNRVLITLFPKFSVGKMSLIVDGCVVVIATIVFRDLMSGFYAILCIIVCCFTSDGLQFVAKKLKKGKQKI